MLIPKFQAINFSSIKNINSQTNKFSSNPIRFKGSLSKDTVEFSSIKVDDSSLTQEQKEVIESLKRGNEGRYQKDIEQCRAYIERLQELMEKHPEDKKEYSDSIMRNEAYIRDYEENIKSGKLHWLTEVAIDKVKKYPELAFMYNDKYSDEDKKAMLAKSGLLVEDNPITDDSVLKNFLQKKLFRMSINDDKYIVMSEKTRQQSERFAKLREAAPYCLAEDVQKLGVDEDEFSSIPDLKIANIADENDEPVYVYDISSPVSQQFFEDLKSKKLMRLPANSIIATYQPKIYTTVDGKPFVADGFVDKENEFNQKIKQGTEAYRKYLKTLPFEMSQVEQNGKTIAFIDYSNPKNAELFNSIRDYTVPKSKYFGEADEERMIPSTNLKKAGYGNVVTLTRLVKEGKLKGEIKTINGKDVAIVCFNADSYKILSAIREKMPNITRAKDLAKELGISQKRITEMIMDGTIDTVDEAIVPYDIAADFIDTSKEKNKEAIEKIKLEQELKAEILNKKREYRKQQRIEEKDVSQRMNSARMAMVWSFMPQTKAIASTLAKNDGYIAKLLAKEDDENVELTQREKIALNSYRKQVWTMAGVEERSLAEAKTKEVLEIYHTSGLKALDIEQQEILKRYGFC